ncbi:MAG: type VI secretion system tube protein TssD [Solirubrobacteraceae bacterium]
MSREPPADALYGQAGLDGWRPEAPFAEWQGEPAAEGEDEGEEQLVTSPAVDRTALVTPPAAPAPTATSSQFYIRIVAGKQGAIPGNATHAGREGWLIGRGFEQQEEVPRDPSTGLPTGARRHSPVTVSLDWSPASPLMFNALTTNEMLPSVTIEFVGPTVAGVESVTQRLTLTNAVIAGLRRTAGSATRPGAPAPVEHVSFVFEKLELTDLRHGTTGSDEWSAPISELEGAPAGEAGEWQVQTPQDSELQQVAAAPAGGSWTTDMYEPERAGVRPCADRTYVA